MSTPPTRRTGAPVRLWAGVSAVLGVVAALCLIVALQVSGVTAPDPAPEASSPARSDLASAATSRPAVAEPASPPVRILIPAIDVAAPVTRLGLNPDRTVEVPVDPMDSGWYRAGPPPGQPGSAVILGHVDSAQGPAVFHRLRVLEPGDRVLVEAADGSTSTFRVLRLATYPNEGFPADRVYASSGPDRLLNLVTCGGDYDPESGYQANVVVYTRWVSAA